MAHVTSTTKRKSFSTYNVLLLLGFVLRVATGSQEKLKSNRHLSVWSPPTEDHAEALGIADRTVERWEKDRKEIKSDPDLSAKASTPEGYQEAKAEVRKRRNVVVPAYRVDDAMGAIKGISEAG